MKLSETSPIIQDSVKKIFDMIKPGWDNIRMIAKLKQRFIGKSDKLLGLDIGTGFVKVAQVKYNGRQALLTHLGLVELPENVVEDGYIVDKARMADTIHDCVVASMADGKAVVAGLGGRNVFSREITMPAMPETELAEAIKWGLEEYIPYPSDSFYYDFAVIGPSEDGINLQILLVAAPHAVVDPLVEAVNAAGLRLVAIETATLAMFRTLHDQGQARYNTDNCLILDIGAHLSQISIFQQGAPVFTRMIPLGGDQFIQVLINELSREVRRTIDYYITQNNRAVIDRIFLTGGGASKEDILPQVIKQLDMPIELHDPFAFIKTVSSFEPRFLQAIGAQMTIAIGLAMRGDEP